MDKLDNILNKAKKLNINNEVLSENVLRSIVDKQPSNISNFKLLKWSIIMSIPILLIVGLLFMSSENQTEKSKNTDQFQVKSLTTQEQKPFEEEEESIDEKFEKMNKKIDSKKKKKVNPNAKLQVMEFKLVDDTTKRKTKFFETLPWNVEGLTILELTDNEFEKLVPNSREDDTTFFIYQENVIDSSRFVKNKLDKLGYRFSDLPLLNFSLGTFSPSRWRYSSKHIDIYDTSKYKKTLYIAYSTTDHISGKGRAMYNLNSSLILDNCSDSIMRYFSDFERNYSMNSYIALFKNKDTIERNRLRSELKRLNDVVFQNLIPVKIEIYPGTNFIFWFYPNEEYLNAIPERYSTSLRKELEIKRRIESGDLDVSDACKGLDESTTVFGICKQFDGALVFENLYPNPNSENSIIKFSLKQDRKLTILISDLNGNIVNELIKNNQYNSGQHEINIPITELEIGIYFITIISDQNEKIIKRFVKI